MSYSRAVFPAPHTVPFGQPCALFIIYLLANFARDGRHHWLTLRPNSKDSDAKDNNSLDEDSRVSEIALTILDDLDEDLDEAFCLIGCFHGEVSHNPVVAKALMLKVPEDQDESGLGDLLALADIEREHFDLLVETLEAAFERLRGSEKGDFLVMALEDIVPLSPKRRGDCNKGEYVFFSETNTD